MNRQRERIKFFCLGLLFALGLVFLAGATDVSAPNYGRYQIASWGTDFGEKGGGFGVFIADTATGETRMVYSRIFGDVGNGTVKKDELEKTFFNIK
jgi:hypothetical protein